MYIRTRLLDIDGWYKRVTSGPLHAKLKRQCVDVHCDVTLFPRPHFPGAHDKRHAVAVAFFPTKPFQFHVPTSLSERAIFSPEIWDFWPFVQRKEALEKLQIAGCTKVSWLWRGA